MKSADKTTLSPREACSNRIARYLAVSLVMAILICAMARPAAAARHAFIVGNADYVHSPKLPNPANDAADMANRLRDLGYRVTLGVNLGRNDFLSRFQSFVRALQPDDLGLIYYAGHGLQIGGENYLVPVDAKLVDQALARATLVGLNALLADLSRATRNRIVILDACRNNPFVEEFAKTAATRGGAMQGLARVFAGVGSYIAYSTQPGNVALDGKGRNSPFTGALLSHIGDGGADVHAVMRKVRAKVQTATQGQQIPWENSSLIDDIAFATENIARSGDLAQTTSDPVLSERYHFVGGLDPKGDNFLALRGGAGSSFPQLASMGPDTLLKIVESKGAWRKVALTDGSQGWAHGNWIKCCRTIASNAISAALRTQTPIKPVSGETCESLWQARNAIWKAVGYCFKSAKAKATFGNAGCSRDEAAAQAAMTNRQRAQVQDLLMRERAMGCR